MAAVKNVGESAVQAIVDAREQRPGARFESLVDVCEAVNWGQVNRRAMESLVKAGALDELGSRVGVLDALEGAIAAAQKRQRASAKGQMDLFGGERSTNVSTIELKATDASLSQLLAWERELLGTYMSDHPLTGVLGAVRQSAEASTLCEIAELESKDVGSTARIVAMIEGVRRITTKSNKSMAVVTCEDLSGRADIVLFPECFERFGGHLEDGAIVDVRGRIDRRGDTLQLICESLTTDLPVPVATVEEPDVVVLRFAAAADQWTEIRAMQLVDDVLKRHEGVSPVVLEIPVGLRTVRHLKSRSRRVEWNAELVQELLSIDGVIGAEILDRGDARMAS